MKFIKQGLSEFNAWCHAHPYALLAVGLWVGLMTSLPDTFWFRLATAAGVVIFLAFYIVTLKRMTAAIVLVLVMLAQNGQSALPHPMPLPDVQPEGIEGAVIGGTVIVVGVVIYYGLKHLCQRLFNRPPNTNAPPDEQASAVYGAQGSCVYPADVLVDDIYAQHLSVTVNAGGALGIKSYRREDLVDIVQFRNEFPDYLTPDRNVASDNIQMGEDWLTYWPQELNEEDLQEVVVESSNDLSNWTSVVRARYPRGMTLEVSDVQDAPATYYRALQ